MALSEPRMFILDPVLVFAARVNQATFAYPLYFFDYDSVTTGVAADVLPGMLLCLGTTPGGDDLGRTRVRKPIDPVALRLFVGASSEGTHDGELSLQDNAYISVYRDYRLWSKIPRIDADGTTYKDADLPVGDNTTLPPPVANCGSGFAGNVGASTGLMNVQFNGLASFAVADGATITGYLWAIGDGTLLTGSVLTSNIITVAFPRGFRYVDLTVTDSNGKTHTAHCPVFADAADYSLSIANIEITTQRSGQGGQTLTVQVNQDISTYKDGSLVMIWDREANSTTDREQMLFIGWMHTEQAQIQASREGTVAGTVLTLVDVAGKLDSLPGFAQALAADSTRDTTKFPAITWTYMPTPNMDKYLHYLMQWHSTALDVADFTLTGTGSQYPFVILTSEGASLWNQIDRRARALVPNFALTCDRRGRISCYPDPMLQEVADRTAVVQASISEDEWSSVRFTTQRPPRTHWLHASAIVASVTAPLNPKTGKLVIPTAFSLAPGDVPGQGVGEMTQGEQLVKSQDALNKATGHRYARANARTSLITISLIEDTAALASIVAWRELEPAYMQWVEITLSAAYAAQRGLTWTAARALLKEVNVRYRNSNTGQVRQVDITCELETVGLPGVTVVKKTIPAVGAQPVPVVFVPPAYGDTSIYYGDINAYVLYSSDAVLRTWDLQAASPVWARVDTGITGTIHDGQYVHVSATTVGMWLMTSTAIWWCGDIMATTPSWSAVLPIATVRASDAPVSGYNAFGVVDFKSMFAYATEPGYLIVATGPPQDTNNIEYAHSYTWHTHDYGATWTQVDMNSFTFSYSGYTSGYFGSPLYGTNIYRSAPGTIWMLRSPPRIGGGGVAAVFKSEDLGHTWTKNFSLSLAVSDPNDAGLLNPYPNATDPSYAAIGETFAANYPALYRSTDGWATATPLADVTGYFGMAYGRRPNKRTFDNTHVMAWWLQNVSPGYYHLLESYDQGATWSLLWNSGTTASSYNTPNGFPSVPNSWVIVKTASGLGATTVRLTLDNFATLQDKQGNLASVLPGGAWAAGKNNGFSLPKV